ncbi:PEP/pyruvate-binding domain-containing protein [Nitratidesulfovibrio vulgaris]|uniref:Phosphoenolpyruvate synthase n=1 Tax=Nitratidesulfovibrio vulgaris (strain DP4) TaxID=391774 RepID=A0A0H3A7Y2_NITV4|nr:PEP/pyruvate-binding domain-containing protein [Nitratidesulfovibrio vulgaris]ABM27590.1 Pyruvate, water dikinase [Nitratidesulfovibrio vulgaris DP4]WCB47355.1 PEP-utilizing enzyme [Nitratidesulfovibrio vulgaris]GEB79657.1 pyruvate phosphate dikinase PEP/pyruvate binding subunit [Desulfovibrio desulfuricans]
MSFFDFLTRGRNTCDLLHAEEGAAARKYRHFKDFLHDNHRALSAVADLEGLYHQGAYSLPEARRHLNELLEATDNLLGDLDRLTGGRYPALHDVLARLNEETGVILSAATPAPCVPPVLSLADVTPDMASACGTKSTNLATMRNVLGIPTPPGFVVTARGFERFIEENALGERIAQALSRCAATARPGDDPVMLERVSAEIRDMVLHAPVPASLSDAILDAYRALEAATHPGVHVAMRSSAVGEDTEASFAGQYVTVLNVTAADILTAYREVLASKYSPRAILYRLSYGLEDRDTPMCVAGIAMVRSRASGVIYTVDPSAPDSGSLKVAALLGLGELLAGGEGSADVFHVDRATGDLRNTELTEKTHRLVCLPDGGISLEAATAEERTRPAIDDAIVQRLHGYGIRLEEYFKCPQDIEWAVAPDGDLFILQSRPLGLVSAHRPQTAVEYTGHPRLITRGRVASPGAASGVVYNALGNNPDHVPAGAILVARTASPDYAGLMGRVRGIVTDVGSGASHLASVAREFGIPALFDTRDATMRLTHGATVTLDADTTSVYEGTVDELASRTAPARKPFFDSPAHHKLRRVLDLVSPLHLLDPRSPEFDPAHCASVHDIIRFAHENAMREMFGLCDDSLDVTRAVRLHLGIPIMLYCIDLGGGLDDGLTSCERVETAHVRSVPMRALLDGLTHPGISWQGGVALNAHSLLSVMASAATADSENLGGDSFAVVSRDYMNISAKFGYHYANIDALCSDRPSQNHVVLKFAGGAGSYFGRSLRVSFLASVLQRLGFGVDIRGDMLEATLTGLDGDAQQELLDQTGRLLAAARLLDMTIGNGADVERMVSMFFDGNYDFLGTARPRQIEGFYTDTGNWSMEQCDDVRCIRQDGSEWGRSVGGESSAVFARMFGPRYQEALDRVETFFHFPLAICQESRMADGSLRLHVRPEGGRMDRAGGLAFGIRNAGNYFVLRLNAVENNVILFEFVNSRRVRLERVDVRIRSGTWAELGVDICGKTVRCLLDGVPLFETVLRITPYGYAGLWTKGDSVTLFRDFTVEPALGLAHPIMQ